jgi:hypothetical protein
MNIITVEMDEPTCKFLLQVVNAVSKYRAVNQADWKALAERLEASLDEVEESETDDDSNYLSSGTTESIC